MFDELKKVKYFKEITYFISLISRDVFGTQASI